MSWDFNHYYRDSSEGLISKLRLSSEKTEQLTSLRQTVRERTKEVFTEAKTIAKNVKKQSMTFKDIKLKLNQTVFRYLSDDDINEISKLIHEMDDLARDDFIKLQPRFWTQGSFQYDTLNLPFQPGQEVDIDDGTYLPMTIFKSEPQVGHALLLLLVDTSLKSLAAENDGWVFEQKKTCGRIKIRHHKAHIDVPMYAIPKDQFQTKQTALDSASQVKQESMESMLLEVNTRESYKLDSENVNLALREGEKKWTISDPKIVEDWFEDSCLRIGKHLRLICRFMKAWRDAQWDLGGPSSISLMTAVVNILDREYHESEDLANTMKIVARLIPGEFCKGIESPDDTDEKLLFPADFDHDSRQQAIVIKMKELHGVLLEAEGAISREFALEKINIAFGERVTNAALIVSAAAAPAFFSEPTKASEPSKINKTMVSG